MQERLVFNYSNRINKLTHYLNEGEHLIFHSRDDMLKGDDTYFNSQDSMMTYFFSSNKDILGAIVSKRNNELDLTILVEERSEIQEKFEGKVDIENIKQLFDLNLQILTSIQYLESLKSNINYLFSYCIEHRDYFTKAFQFIFKIENKLKIKIENQYTRIAELRVVKEENEIDSIKIANTYAKETFEYILKNTSKYENEHDIFAYMSFKTFEQHSTHSFYPIIATGKNASVLHYEQHDSNIQDTDLILLDFGCEYLSYKSDISRTFPKSGKFSKRQREVYEAVLRIQEFAFSQIKIGEDIKEYELKVRDKVGEELIKLKLLTKGQIENNNSCIKEYYPHRCSHYLGLDTHDCGDYLTTFKVGMVLTVEPGIYIEEESIGIRIEDNIVIGENGIENLSKDIIKSVEEIEEFMKVN